MRKLFALFVGMVFAASANAGITPFKCIYIQANVVPTGCGEIYVDAKNEEDQKYIVYQDEDYMDDTFTFKYVGGENGGGGDAIGCNAGAGVFEVKMYAEPLPGFELVCYADKIIEGDQPVYTASDCFAVIHGDAENARTWDFAYTGEGDMINIGNKNHTKEDGTSADDTPSREDCMQPSFWEEYQEPETYVYVIFREIGEEYPKLDENSTTIHEIEAPTISYSNGKLTFACATPDVTFDYSITSEDVKNGTGAEVELTGVYTVKVKAKRTGYKDSEEVTQTINLLEGGGEQNYDLNGDGKISTADIQVIINEMKK